LPDGWRAEIDRCLQVLLVDEDRDVRSAVGGAYEWRGRALSDDDLRDEQLASSHLIKAMTIDEQPAHELVSADVSATQCVRRDASRLTSFSFSFSFSSSQ
jgi:hypothetical protein